MLKDLFNGPTRLETLIFRHILQETVQGKEHKDHKIPDRMGENNRDQISLSLVEPAPEKTAGRGGKEKHEVQGEDMDKGIDGSG